MNFYPRLLVRLQAGLSMIEVLVTMAIVAFGVLGLLGLQARALSYQRDSFDRRTAAEMVSQLAERIRANHMGLVNGDYQSGFTVATPTPVAISACATPTACTEAELATRDLGQWFAEYRRRIPGGATYVDWDPANTRSIRISLAWPEPQQTANDPLCDQLNLRPLIGGSIPNGYRCFDTAVLP